MDNKDYTPMFPWYKGFIGTIEQQSPGSRNFTVRGVYRVLEEGGDELEITELPIGKWTRDYKTFLEELAQKDEIEEIREYHQENRVHFVLKVPKL
jgi:DNA topoisomerase-2